MDAARRRDGPELFTISDSGARYDLTGLVLRVVIQFGSTRIELNSDDPAEIEVLDQTDADTRGQFNVTLTAEQRASLPLESPARYEVFQEADGFVQRLVYGDLTAKLWVPYDA
jgi:hypothetical protein